MQIEKSVRYVKAEDIKGQDKVSFKILDEPIEVDGQFGKKIETVVKMNFGEALKVKWSISNTNRDKLIDLYGKDTTEWIGKTIPVHTEKINGKDAIMIEHSRLEDKPQ